MTDPKAKRTGHGKVFRGRWNVGIRAGDSACAVGHLISPQRRIQVTRGADNTANVHQHGQHAKDRLLIAAMDRGRRAEGGSGLLFDLRSLPEVSHRGFQPVFECRGHVAEVARGAEDQGICPLELDWLRLRKPGPQTFTGAPPSLVLSDHVVRLEVGYTPNPDLVLGRDLSTFGNRLGQLRRVTIAAVEADQDIHGSPRLHRSLPSATSTNRRARMAPTEKRCFRALAKAS